MRVMIYQALSATTTSATNTIRQIDSFLPLAAFIFIHKQNITKSSEQAQKRIEKERKCVRKKSRFRRAFSSVCVE